MPNLGEQAGALVWYHTMELAPGVVTKGMFDVRATVGRLPWPDLRGKRCLDVGTCDGFWAFEMERRGAREVVAIDLADPSARDLTVGVQAANPSFGGVKPTFALAHSCLGSSVQWRDLSVYDLSPDVVGEFDFVFIGSLLLHLRDPVLALQAVRSVTAGTVLSHDTISPMMTLLAPKTPAARFYGNMEQMWWVPNRAARHRLFIAAGFDVAETGGITWVSMDLAPLRPRDLRRRPLFKLLLAARGVPHTWVLARPAGG